MVIIKLCDRDNQRQPLDATPGPALSREAVLREVALAAPGDLLVFVGPEPTLSPLLPECLLRAKQAGHPTRIVTNGLRAADPAYARALVRAGLDEAWISLHTADPARSDAWSATPGAWAAARAGIGHLLEVGVAVAPRAALARPVLPGLLDLARWAATAFARPLPLMLELFVPIADEWTPWVAPPVELAAALHSVLTEARREGWRLRFADPGGPPPCLLPGDETFFDRCDAAARALPFVPPQGFVQGPPCPACNWRAQCAGLPTEYARRAGWKGLAPLSPHLAPAARPTNRPSADPEAPGRRRVLDFLLGARCVNDCLFCNEGGRRARRPVHDRATIAHGLDDALRAGDGPLWVSFAGGEPTLNPRFAEYVALAREKGAARIGVVSNGHRLADPRFARAALQAGLNEARLSVHGATAQTHDALTGRRGSFDDLGAAAANLRAWRQAGGNLTVVVHCCLNRKNLGELVALHALLASWGVDRLALNIVEVGARAAERFEELTPRMTEAARALQELVAALPPDAVPDVAADSLPPCVAPDLIPLLGLRTELVKPDAGGGLIVEPPGRGKSFGTPCEHCRWRGSLCDGVWTGYVARRGWDEFGPPPNA